MQPDLSLIWSHLRPQSEHFIAVALLYMLKWAAVIDL